MISQQQIKTYASLKQKKFRNEHQLFLVEGRKSVEELLKSDFQLLHLIGKEESVEAFARQGIPVDVVNSKTLDRISTLKTASDIIAVVEMPQHALDVNFEGKSILIDDIQDPGNLGTIIRTAHWFGFEQIICSENSVDLYNSKVIQASMGAIFKLPVLYRNLQTLIQEYHSKDIRVLGTFLEGKSVYEYQYKNNDVFVLGNEGKGISEPIESLIKEKVSIPIFSVGIPTESLNIASAAAVVCSEMARR
jgi:TrmH family RNA methyltransferase